MTLQESEYQINIEKNKFLFLKIVLFKAVFSNT